MPMDPVRSPVSSLKARTDGRVWSQHVAPRGIWTVADVAERWGLHRSHVWRIMRAAGLRPWLREHRITKRLPSGAVGHPVRRFAVLTDGDVALLCAYRLGMRPYSKRAKPA